MGLDDLYQASAMPHADKHIGQILHMREMAATGDWEPVVVPPHRESSALHRDFAQLAEATATFPENNKQGLLRKSRSRFEYAGEADGKDALRIALIERGGAEVAVQWLALPPAQAAQASA